MKDPEIGSVVAADPVVDAALLAECLEAKVVSAPAWPFRAAWRLHLVPASPGLFDTTEVRTVEHDWFGEPWTS